MFEKIVVPLNGLPSAEAAIAPGAEIARRYGAELHLVFVDSMTRLDPMSDEFAAVDGVTYHDRELRLVAESLESDLGIRVVTTRLSGTVGVVEAIVGYVTGVGADLVAMATRGRTGWRRAFAGSVADDLLHSLTGRLLLVRIDEAKTAPAGPFHRILVGLDGSDTAERGLDGARAVAQVGKSTIILARVVTPLPIAYDAGLIGVVAPSDEGATEQLVEDARTYLDRLADTIREEDGVEVETIVQVAGGVSARSAAARRLAAIARDKGIDLVSLTTRKRGASRLLLRSVADTLLRKTQCALLLCGAQDSTIEAEPSRHDSEAAAEA